jgi:hypothetical protein
MVFVIDNQGKPGAIIPENEHFLGHSQIKIQVWRAGSPAEYVNATELRLMKIDDLARFN